VEVGDREGEGGREGDRDDEVVGLVDDARASSSGSVVALVEEGGHTAVADGGPPPCLIGETGQGILGKWPHFLEAADVGV
jgi:hypothetical protein